MTRFAVLVGLATPSCVGAAGALAPVLPDCSGALLAPQEAALGSCDPQGFGGGMVEYGRFPDAIPTRVPMIAKHGPSRDQMVADLRKVMKLNRHNSLLKTGRIAESLAEHQAIMAALLVRDAQRTQERMREHFANGLEAAE